jgi:Uma2 family endonuclease
MIVQCKQLFLNIHDRGDKYMGAAVRQEYMFNEPEGETSVNEFIDFINRPENQTKKFELLDGYIIMTAGNTSMNHIRVCGHIARRIGNYLEGKKCEVFQDANVYLYKEEIGRCKNIFQPDIIIGCDSRKATNKGYEGTPEFVAEVTGKSTSRMDYLLNAKPICVSA